MKPLLQIACGDEAVTAVVAGAGNDQYRFAAVACQRASELCRRETGALHQRHVRVARLDAADVCRQVERRSVSNFDLHRE